MTDDLERLQRWVDSGATLRILSTRHDQITVALMTCDGGEEMGRITTSDPDTLAWCENNAD